MSQDKSSLNQLEELDVIAARELNVGNAFHAFRFNAEPGAIDAETQTLIDKAAEKFGIASADLTSIARTEATEDNALANFARGVLAAAQLQNTSG